MTRGHKRRACHIHPEKQRYPSEAIAEAAREQIEDEGGYHGYVPVRAYECPYCHGWHLTARERPPRYTDDVA